MAKLVTAARDPSCRELGLDDPPPPAPAGAIAAAGGGGGACRGLAVDAAREAERSRQLSLLTRYRESGLEVIER